MSKTDEAIREMDVDTETELNTILPGNEPLDGLVAEHQGGLEYTVLSVRDGEPTLHYVEIGPEPSCTCEDMEYNRNGREACKHLCKAALADRMDPQELAVSELVNVTATVSSAAREAKDAAAQARDAATEIETGLVNVRDAEADTSGDTSEERSDNDPTENTHSNDADAASAAEKLQKAFDDVIDGFAVEYNQGVVWVNKTPDAPETLPGPGNVDTFETFLQNPDQLEYVYDDHEYAGAEPGQYFSNMIRPENVEEYISEVLE